MKHVLLIVIACILGVAATLFALMVRRDEPLFGLAGLTAAICAGLVAVAYSGFGEQLP